MISGNMKTNPKLLYLLEQSKKIMNAMTPLQKALAFAQRRRSWVMGEMMLGNDGKEGISRERAEALYANTPEGALLAELERRMTGDAPTIGQRAAHYGDGIQPWDHIKAVGWGPQFAAGNALKYVRRYKNKNGEDDLQKGRWYYHELVEMVAKVDAHTPATPQGAIGHLAHAPSVLGTLELLLTQDERALLRRADGQE